MMPSLEKDGANGVMKFIKCVQSELHEIQGSHRRGRQLHQELINRHHKIHGAGFGFMIIGKYTYRTIFPTEKLAVL